MQLLHIADLHFGAEDSALVDAFATYCEEAQPDMIIAAGDFTQDGRKQEFEAAADFFRQLGVPVIGAAGNHDVPVRSVWQRFASPWRRFHHALGGAVTDRYESEGLHVETLHTARRAQFQLDWSLGRAAASDVSEVVNRLARSTSRTRILTCHHPLRAPGGNQGRARTRYGETAAGVVETACDLVLTGHLHQTFVLPAVQGDHTCWFVGAGTTFSHRTRTEPAGFNRIEIQDRAIRVQHVVAEDGTRFAPGRVWNLERESLS
ncbi:metallophosphoesterase family protein [Maricaulis sp. CAU 1757]